MNRREFIRNSLATGAAVAAGGIPALTPPAEGAPAPLRPPGSRPEADFAARCLRCMRCVDACPNRALEPLPLWGAGALAGTPTMRPRRAACMLCMDHPGTHLACTAACPSGALEVVEKTPEDIRAKVRIGVAEIDLGLCYSYNNWSCGACYRACPLAGSAMTLGNWEKPVVHAEHCVGCGCCERSCIRYPHAIRVKSESGR